MQHMNLIGTEQIQRAANTMSSASDEMRRAAMSIDNSLELFIRRFEELVQRLEALTEPHE